MSLVETIVVRKEKYFMYSQKKERIIIEGVNLIKRHTRPSQDNPQGGIVEREGTLHVSNVMVVHGGKPTRIGYKKLEDGSKVRISKRTGEEIG